MADLYDILMAADEPSAQEQARMLADALRGQKARAQGYSLHPLLQRYGEGLARDASAQQGQLAEAGQVRSGRALQRALAQQQQDFSAGEAEKGRAATAREHALQRAMQLRLAGMRQVDPDDALKREKLRLDIEKARRDLEHPPESHGDAVSKSIEHQETEKDVERYGQRTEGTASVLNDLKTLQDAAAKEDIPGVSKGYRFVPDFMEGLLLDGDELKVRQAARGMVGNLLKLRSGTAASDAEVARVMAETGMGPNSGEDEFRTGLQRLAQTYRDELQQKQRAMRPEAQKRAKERGLLMAEDFPGATPAPTPAAAATPAAPASSEVEEARKWLQANPTHPKAASVRAALEQMEATR